MSLFKAITTFEFPMFIILAALAVLLLFGIRVAKHRQWLEDPLGLEVSKQIQGFAAIGIIIHHITQALEEDAGILMPFAEFGVLFVGIFFFFSGYGLYTSLKTKPYYLKGFLKKRLSTILVPFYTCNLVFVLAICICGVKLEPMEALAVISGWSLINSHMWYIIEIAILYLAFFAIYRLIKNRTAATVVMSIFVVLMMAGSLMLCHGEDYSCSYWFMGEWWYNSSFLFVIGILVSKHIDELRKIARKAYVLMLIVFTGLIAAFGLQTRYALNTWSYWSEEPGVDPAYWDKIRCLAFQLPWIISFVFAVILLMMKVRFGNRVLKFLGSISLELYLIHNLFLNGLAEGSVFRVQSASMYITLTILLSIGFAVILHGVDKYLIDLINGKKTLGSTSGRIHSIDVMRIVMAFLVVTIHIPFFGKAGEVFITYGKTAVPFFLVVCGYFLYRDDTAQMMKRLLKQTKKMFILFVGANVFYMAGFAAYDKAVNGSLDETLACFSPKAITDFLLYNLSPFSEHLWFLGSLLYALLIMLLLNKLKVLKHAMFAAPALVAAYCVLSHMGIGEGYQLRNAILVGLSYTMMGMLIRRCEKKILSFKFLTPVLAVLFAVCCTTAIIELNTYKQGLAVPFISCEILTYVIVLLCLKFPDFGMGTLAEKLGRDCSLPIYIMHIATVGLLEMTKNTGFLSAFAAVTVFVITAAYSALYVKIKHTIVARKESHPDPVIDLSSIKTHTP